MDLEPGDGLGGGASDLGEQAVVVDPSGASGGLDGQRASGVDGTDVDTLFGNDESAAACSAAPVRGVSGRFVLRSVRGAGKAGGPARGHVER